MQLVWIASLFFAVLIALFAVQNTTPVSVNLLAWRLEAVAVSTLVLAAAALGALLTYLFGLSRGIRSRMALRGNRSTIRDQETVIAELRARVRELEREVEIREYPSGAARAAGVGGRELESGSVGERELAGESPGAPLPLPSPAARQPGGPTPDAPAGPRG